MKSHSDLRLIIKEKEFDDKAVILAKEAIKLKEDSNNINGEIAYAAFKFNIDQWVLKVTTLLSQSFSESNNKFVTDFIASFSPFHNTASLKSRPYYELFVIQKARLNDLYIAFVAALKIISISEAVMNPESINLEKRKKYTTNDKLSFLLETLYELRGDIYFSVDEILLGNGIKYHSQNEGRELALLLKEQGFVEISYAKKGDLCLSITSKGSLIVEEQIKNKPKKRHMEEESELVVFISHGRSQLWHKVERFINKKLNLDTIELADQTNRGRTIIEKFEEEVDECDYAIVVMTAEDEQKDGELRARENVIHEIGYLQGTLGRENVLVLKQSGITPFSNMSGIVYESFTGENIDSTFERIRQELDDCLERLEEGEVE